MTPWDAQEARDLLAELPPEKDAALLHLLMCPTCRTWATRRLLREAGAGERLADEDAIWSRLHERLPWLLEEADCRSAETEALFVDLVGHAEDEQPKVLQNPPAAPAGREHPDPGDLLAFARCEASQTARRAIVRHLLRGCPACAAAVRPVFDPGGAHAWKRSAASGEGHQRG